MERLTKTLDNGRIVTTESEVLSYGETVDGCFLNYFTGEAIDHLAAYEDTGLEPEEVKEITSWSYGHFHKKMGDWLKAEQEGRLVVLPCKVGDTVWFNTYKNNATECVGIQPHEVKRVNVCFLTDGAEIPEWEFGKTVFLTREEAEKALKGVSEDANN